MTETLTSPTTGKTLVRAGVWATTLTRFDEAKPIPVQREFIEVVVFDLRPKPTSLFGHAAIAIGDIVYSRAPKTYFKGGYRRYLISNTRAPRVNPDGTLERGRPHRTGVGFLLWVSPRERKLIQDELERRVAEDKPYHLWSNSCSTNVTDVLELAGIMARDPRGFGEATPVTPAELHGVLKKSNRLVETRIYKKGWEGGASANW
ncbi:hypothetical protein AB4120_06135 [Cupriavidus sp. 2KB_3]|uniref:hypothetical protein n=1 Tax=Cupriavidus TaxID=106589 RepID=UPI0011EC170F|nr:hypothetical protein [Cupriavidus campinensis]